jgi:hypothetical protein
LRRSKPLADFRNRARHLFGIGANILAGYSPPNVFPAFAPSQTFTAVTIRGFNYDSKWNLSMTEGKKYGGMRKVKTRREKPFKLEISNPRC